MINSSNLENISKPPCNIEEAIIEKFLVSYRDNFENEKIRNEIDSLLKIYLRTTNFLSKNN